MLPFLGMDIDKRACINPHFPEDPSINHKRHRLEFHLPFLRPFFPAVAFQRGSLRVNIGCIMCV